MSGGSFDYSYCKVEEMADTLSGSDDVLRVAFSEHLRKVSQAMHDIEWVDSGDYGPGDEHKAIRAVLGEIDGIIVSKIIKTKLLALADQIRKVAEESP